MHFRDVVLCDNPRCGAILRITSAPGPISVRLQTAPFGSYVVCPRCDRRTIIELTGADAGPLEFIDSRRVGPPSL